MYEMKLKAWDRVLQKMHDPIELKRLLAYLWLQPDPNATSYVEIKKHFSDITWLHYTGACDKNGRDIFDGDIVKVISTVDSVKQFEGDFYINWGSYFDGEYVDDIQCWLATGILNIPVRNVMTGYKKSFSISDVICSKDNGVEVIGNIYENPDLIPFKPENISV